MEIKIHEFQISILRELLFKPNARFRDLNKVDITNDHFSFHLKHLINEGLIIKQDGLYSLTDDGKEFANRMDTEGLKIERQAKLAIAIHAIRYRNGKKEYLIHQRLKEPFYGWYGSHSAKISWGETPLLCAKREFLEESGLTGKFELKAIEHYHHFHKDGRLLEDKYFWVYRVTATTLFAALSMLDGTIIGDCLPRHRHQEFIRFLKKIDGETPAGLDLHLIVDNYGTHKHPSVKNWLKRHPRFHLHFIPTSSSWLNMVERWFREITDKRIRRGTFRNVPALIDAIKNYIDNHNQTPQVFVWTAPVAQILTKVAKCKEALDALHLGLRMVCNLRHPSDSFRNCRGLLPCL